MLLTARAKVGGLPGHGELIHQLNPMPPLEAARLFLRRIQPSSAQTLANLTALLSAGGGGSVSPNIVGEAGAGGGGGGGRAVGLASPSGHSTPYTSMPGLRGLAARF